MHLKNIQYNELGQVISNSLHGNGLGDYLQSVDYRYNERGWLTRINELNTGSCIGRACTTTLSLKVMLEGPTIDNGMMNTGLNNRGLLPGQTPTSPLAMPTPDGQPYKAAPWGYPGIEGMMGNIDSLYTPETVDWILVSLRTGTTPDTEIFKTAALLQNDGTVQLTDEAALPDDMPPVYIVIEHSNHIGVMTPQPVTIENDSLIYDFTTADSYTANGVGVGQKYDPASGKWMMLAGEGATSEGEPSYDITGDEKSMWSEINGNFGEYFITDFDRNGDVNGGDKILWEANNGSSSRVPRNVLTAVPELDAGTGSIGPVTDPQSPPSAADDLFRMRIQYRYTGGALNATPQYNGNISHVRWQVNDNPADIKTYRYAYDQLDRLTEALYRRSPNYTADVDAYSVQDITYDLNGNIQSLKRNGGTNLDAIDDLTYGYNGNQLTYVDDATGNPEGFTDNYAGVEYTFDDNGNMTSDFNKGITSITYNHLNLPEVITLSGGTITFLYDANGNKLRKTVSGTSQDYLGGIEYSGGAIEAVYHEEGRATLQSGVWRYEYYLKDHLGNTRVIFSDTNNDGEPEILQEADYYPFGMRHDRSTTATNHYLYNGKELNTDLGLDWYDYGARWLDVETGRWSSIDLHAELYKSWTPYNYVYNNPLIYTDPTGMDGDLVNGLTIYIINDGSVSDAVFRASVAAYQENVANVWGAVNGQDLSRVNYQILDGNSFNPANLLPSENILTFGNQDESKVVNAPLWNIGYMNTSDTDDNTAAHEFGHFLGLSDRYYEGVTSNLTTGDLKPARNYNVFTSIPNSKVGDPEYMSDNNLYSTGSTTLTSYQLSIANSPTVEKNYQGRIGYYYLINKNTKEEYWKIKFRVSRSGKVHWDKKANWDKLPMIKKKNRRNNKGYERLVDRINHYW